MRAEKDRENHVASPRRYMWERRREGPGSLQVTRAEEEMGGRREEEEVGMEFWREAIIYVPGSWLTNRGRECSLGFVAECQMHGR